MSVSDAHGFAIRPARPEDAEGMASVHARSWPATYAGLVPGPLIEDVVAARSVRVERWQRSLAITDLSHGAFVAELGNRIVGFAFWGPARELDSGPKTGEVYAIYLDPQVVGRGIGRSLLVDATRALRTAGFLRAVLWVLESNARARRFYEAAGWLPDGETRSEERPGGTLREVRYARELRDQPRP